MDDSKEFTFIVRSGEKKRYNAGFYDYHQSTPKYSISFYVPETERKRVTVNQVMTGSQDHCSFAWDIVNDSDCIAFFTVKKDGVIVQHKA
jgi:hypothetical protein